MAIILSDAATKSVGETVPGELFQVALRSSYALCITIELNEKPSVLIGGLQSPEFDRPSWFHVERSTPCLSFGLDWAIEPIVGAETFPSRSINTEDEGLLLLHGEEASLRFDRVSNPTHYEYLHASLMGNGRVEREMHAAPYRQWKIWMTAADRDRPKGRPLITFGVD